MRSSIHHRPTGFTLIELLVVITIIALLASIAIPTGNIIMKKARNTQTMALMRGVIVGIKGYQTEYNRYPQISEDVTQDIGPIPVEGSILDALRPNIANPSADSVKYNPRNINFYDPPMAKNRTAGYDQTSDTIFDSWGAAIQLVYDANNDGQVMTPEKAKGNSDPEYLQTTVALYSKGSPPNDVNKDYVTTWR